MHDLFFLFDYLESNRCLKNQVLMASIYLSSVLRTFEMAENVTIVKHRKGDNSHERLFESY